MRNWKRQLPDFEFERAISEEFIVIGVDEVGRGALAGPVVAGAVVVEDLTAPIDWLELGIDDSKRVLPNKREKLAKIIQENCPFGIGEASVAEIDRIGIVKATQRAIRRAISNLRTSRSHILNQKEFVLLDAFNVKHIPRVGIKNQKAIIKGDQKSISIAAASIVAKVYRDQLMVKIHEENLNFRGYFWNQNKGYGTKEHLAAIKKFGVVKFHRRDFVD